MDKFDAFIQKGKFTEDLKIFYPGISDLTLKPYLTEKVNQAAEDFRTISINPNPDKYQYLQAIKEGLSRFNSKLLLDTEDRERVCLYFEELMNMVGLESSDGQLNTFLYGFDPMNG